MELERRLNYLLIFIWNIIDGQRQENQPPTCRSSTSSPEENSAVNLSDQEDQAQAIGICNIIYVDAPSPPSLNLSGGRIWEAKGEELAESLYLREELELELEKKFKQFKNVFDIFNPRVKRQGGKVLNLLLDIPPFHKIPGSTLGGWIVVITILGLVLFHVISEFHLPT